MGKRKFIHDCLEKLEDINAYHIKGGKMASTGQYNIKDFTDNVLPILKDLIEDNINLKIKVGQLENQIGDLSGKRFEREDFSKIKIGGTD